MTVSRSARLAAERVYLIASPPTAAPDGSPEAAAWLSKVAAVGRVGVGLIQLRAKQVSTAARRAWLAALRERLLPSTLLIVNDDLSAVHDARGRPLADGVHLGREDARALGYPSVAAGLAAARTHLSHEFLLGTSTRTLAELEAAVDAGVDHAGFGAMAATATKGDTQLADPRELERCVRGCPGFPLFPIGGLGLHNLGLLEAAGVRRLAVASAILEAHDPCEAARALLEWTRRQDVPGRSA